jgi:uncharacterized protein
MSLKAQLDSALKQAMKDKDTAALDAIRAVRSALKTQEIDKKKEASEEDLLALLQKAVKQRRESIVSFEKGNRSDLIQKEQDQIKVLEKFLPEALNPQQIEALVNEAVIAVKASGPKDMGKVMGWLMPKIKGKADGNLVNQSVKKLLGA